MPEPRGVSVALLKGGVGKSTIAINLTDQLAKRGHDALFIDLDPNGHATIGLGFEDAYTASHDIGNVLLGDDDPLSVVESTEWGFDVVPSSSNLEEVANNVDSAPYSVLKLRRNLVEPLLGDEYDYVVTDSPASRGVLSDSALVATENLIVPLTPGNEPIAGFRRMMDRQIQPLRQEIDLDILAMVPNRLSDRIDQQTEDRILLEELNEELGEFVPPFARITPEEFEAIDNGATPPKPGIRDRKAVTKAYGQGMPLSEYDPENDQLEHLETLATIVEEGSANV